MPNLEDNTTFYRDVLHDLITLGQHLAHQVHAAAGTDLPLEEATVAFDRTARAVRRTVALARTLEDPARPRILARRRILREVEDTIARTWRPDSETLKAELHERLDTPELEDELGHRPTQDIIADIIRDLGLAAMPGFPTPWPRRTPAAIQALNARAGQMPPPACGKGVGGAGQGSMSSCSWIAGGGEGASTPPDPAARYPHPKTSGPAPVPAV